MSFTTIQLLSWSGKFCCLEIVSYCTKIVILTKAVNVMLKVVHQSNRRLEITKSAEWTSITVYYQQEKLATY